MAAGLTVGLAGIFALAQFNPTRRALRRLRPAGSGPHPAAALDRLVPDALIADSGHQRIVTEVADGDPGYGETARTLCVARPALRCATWRTLSSVFDQLRSIIFCRFLTFGQSPSPGGPPAGCGA